MVHRQWADHELMRATHTSTLLGVLSSVTLLSLGACSDNTSSVSTSSAAPTTVATADSSVATDGTAATQTTVAGAPGQPPGGAGGQTSAPDYAGSDTGLTLSGGSQSASGDTFNADTDDTTAVLVTGGGTLTLTDVVVSTTGASSSSDSSSFYGLDSGVLATEGSSITMTGGSVTTSGDGANAIFATGDGATVTLSGVIVSATGQYAHGIMATQGGTLVATDVQIDTAGANAAAVATDRGSGTITVVGGSATTSGQDSPGLYSTGVLDVTGMTIVATGSECAVIEGSNSITLTDTDMTCSQKSGVMIYQSMSGDAEGVDGVFTMTGGSLTAAAGPLFYVTNTNAEITLTGADLTASSGVLLDASAGNWGSDGANGGAATLAGDGQVLTGDVTVDSISTVNIVLANGSAWTGALDTANAGGTTSVTLDATSTWTLTADSYVGALAGLALSGTSVTNVVGNGHTLYYDATDAANSALTGATYTLSGGGTLTPA